MQASCVILCAMAAIVLVTGLDHSDDRATCGASHSAEPHEPGNAALLQLSLSSSPGQATSQKQNQAQETSTSAKQHSKAANKLGDHVKKPSKATQTSTPAKEQSKAPTMSSLVVKAAKLMNQTKAASKLSLVIEQSKVTEKSTKQSKTEEKLAKPTTVKKANKASDKVHHNPAPLTMASKVHDAVSHGKHAGTASKRIADKHRDKAEEHAESEDLHATRRQRKKQMPEEDASHDSASRLSQALFGLMILLPIAFLVCGSPFGASPTLGETKLRDHPDLFSSYLTDQQNSHD
jgi:chemotaxis protein histidine kinase CheA